MLELVTWFGGDNMEALEAIEAAWWANWYSKDYSWVGLCSKPWGGLVQNWTLQQYWENQKDRLIEAPDGKLYTRFHLPLFCDVTRNGVTTRVPTEKMDWSDETWDALYGEIREQGRFLNGKEDANAGRPGSGLIIRGDGMILREFPAGFPMDFFSGHFRDCCFLRDVKLPSAVHNNHVLDFSSALFRANLEFRGHGVIDLSCHS